MVFVATYDYAIYFGVLNCQSTQCSHFEGFQLNQQNIECEDPNSNTMVYNLLAVYFRNRIIAFAMGNDAMSLQG